MTLSPEALLRHPVPYKWPPNISRYREPERQPSDLRQKFSDLALLKWDTAWTNRFQPFIRDLRTYRFQKHSVDVLRRDNDGSGQLPFGQAVLYLANHGGFFPEITPPLKAILAPTGVECCIAESFVITGPADSGNTIWMETGSSPEEDWNDCQKCFCVVFLLAPGTLKLDHWDHRNPHNMQPDSQSYVLLPEILQYCEDHHTRRAALTDGRSTLFLQLIPPTMFVSFYPPPRPFFVEVKRVDTEPVQLCIAWLIYEEAMQCGIWNLYTMQVEQPCLGALNGPSIALPSFDSVLQRSCMADFDLYTMQRDVRHWKQFLRWKAVKMDEAKARLHLPGEILVGEKNSFTKNHTLFRSSVPIPPIPQDTMARIPSTRPKDVVASAATSGTAELFYFKVTGIIRVQCETYSQVLSGVVKHCGVQSNPLCLKLYDERLFPTPLYDRSQHDLFFRSGDETSLDRLLTWNPAGDLACREESAFDRLKLFQGSLLPHSYGFHHFTFPDGHRCIGFLMEFIDGVSLDKEGIQELPEDSQKEFVLTLRHCLRILRYHQVEQTDWHPGQILIVFGTQHEVVFIDFAFALQHPDTSHTPATRDWSVCRNRALYDVLGWDKIEFIRPLWFELDENEY